MIELEKLVRQVKDISAKTIFPGVAERVLISPETVGSKEAILKHYVAESGAKFEFEYPSEAVFYFMSGEGFATVELYQPYTSDIALEPYSAFWVPPGRKVTIQSTSEGPLRFLMTSTTEKQERVDSGPGRRNPVVSSRSQAMLYPLLKTFGLEHRMFFLERPFKYLGGIYNTEYERYPAGSVQLKHHHLDAEQNVYVTRGYGKMTMGEDEVDIKPGTVVFIPKLMEHSLKNTSTHFLDFFVMMNRV